MHREHLHRLLSARPARLDTVPASVPRAAVAVIFTGAGQVLFIRRSDHPGDRWSGHMAFPGGRVEEVDPDLRATAERETAEEVGLDLPRAAWVGRLDDVSSPFGRRPPLVLVSPHVYWLPRSPALRPNGEVAATHWFDWARLTRGEGRGIRPVRYRGVDWELPAVRLDGTEIWGLTLRVVDDLLARGVAPGASR